MAMSEPSIAQYTVGWICALQEEFDAACRMLDEEFEGPQESEANDDNTYLFGRVNKHNVVVGCLPGGQYGTNAAAVVANNMIRSFPQLRFALMVGIGGGAPTRGADIRLGDVVVSEPWGTLGGLVQLDLGKRLSDGTFKRKGQLAAPPNILLGVLPHMKRLHNDLKTPDRIAEHIKLMDDMPEYQRPSQDQLYRAKYAHRGGEDCEDCEPEGLAHRLKRSTRRAVIVHYGLIATSNSVIKNPKSRDDYSRELGVLCFEMEAAGLANNVPYLVIRGICNYSDSHKNDKWRNYAALTAAAYARELLHNLKPKKVSHLSPWATDGSDIM